MKSIGLSLPWDYLADRILSNDCLALKDIFNNPEECLDLLKEQGVSVIELRHRSPDLTFSDMEAVFQSLIKYNMDISIHGELYPHGDKWTLKEVFPWMETASALLPPSYELMVTLHPVTGAESDAECREATVRFLNSLYRELSSESLSFRLALENQRRKGRGTVGTSFNEIIELCRKTEAGDIGICWDMGHGHANYLLDESDYTQFPPTDFTSAVWHTHIHDLGPDGRTHWPLSEERIPLLENIALLQEAGYDGILNLELSFERFRNQIDSKQSLLESIKRLKRNI